MYGLEWLAIASAIDSNTRAVQSYNNTTVEKVDTTKIEKLLAEQNALLAEQNKIATETPEETKARHEKEYKAKLKAEMERRAREEALRKEAIEREKRRQEYLNSDEYKKFLAEKEEENKKARRNKISIYVGVISSICIIVIATILIIALNHGFDNSLVQSSQSKIENIEYIPNTEVIKEDVTVEEKIDYLSLNYSFTEKCAHVSSGSKNSSWTGTSYLKVNATVNNRDIIIEADFKSESDDIVNLWGTDDDYTNNNIYMITFDSGHGYYDYYSIGYIAPTKLNSEKNKVIFTNCSEEVLKKFYDYYKNGWTIEIWFEKCK